MRVVECGVICFQGLAVLRFCFNSTMFTLFLTLFGVDGGAVIKGF